jgi:hypothetical protein
MILTGTGIIDSQRISSDTVNWVVGGAPGSAASTNKIAWSPDGISWTKGTITDNSNVTNVYGIAYNGTIWVAVGQGTNRLMTSADGKSWTSSNALNTFFSIGWSVAWNGTYFVAAGVTINTTGSATAYSTNGTSWTGSAQSLLGGPTTSSRKIYWDGSRWYILGTFTSSTSSFKAAYTSTSTGASGWVGITLGADLFNSFATGFAYNGTNTRIMTGNNGAQTSPPYYGLAYSTVNPATSFTTRTNLGNSFFGNIWSNYGGGRFLVGGIGTAGNASIQYSSDGITWTNSSNSDAIFGNSSSGYPLSIAWNGSVFVAGGFNKVGYSFDGDAWNNTTSALGSTAIYAIASKTAPNLYPPLP